MNKIEKMCMSLLAFGTTQGARAGYQEEEILSMMGEINCTALYSALCEKAEPVYTYTVVGELPITLKYCGAKLFSENAALLWREPVFQADDGELCTARYLELWMREDMTLAVTSCFRTVCGNEEYITEYREYKGESWPVTEHTPDILDVVDSLFDLYPEDTEPDGMVIYEH